MNLHADKQELARFIGALFKHADENTFASLRSFDQKDRGVPPPIIHPVRLTGDIARLIEEASIVATRTANLPSPAVFAPPVCTFSNPDRARGVDIANGLTLSVEIDEGDTGAARKRLEGLLGTATVVVASGGEWMDPNTGEIHQKLHLHWRLSEPTRDEEDHARLRQARDMAARLVGADPTGKPVVHPLRWPGSWNQKSKPRLSRIIECSESSEIHLPEAIDLLSEAIEASGYARADMPRSGKPEADIGLIHAAMRAIPNADVHYDQWIRFGYAVYRATGGVGFAIWDEWSQKSTKYNGTKNELAWKRIANAINGSEATKTVGAGTIFFHAFEAGWSKPEPEPPPPVEDEGYWSNVEADLGLLKEEPIQATKTNGTPVAPAFIATPFDPGVFATLEPRKWVYGHFLIRRFLSVLGAPGGTGKTAYGMTVAVSVALGRSLLGEKVHDPGPVWIYNLEDPGDEAYRRLQAICIQHQINPDDLVGKLYMDSGRERPLVVAERTETGAVVATPLVEPMIEEIRRRKLKMMNVDPFIKSHRLEENRNEQVDFAATLWNRIASETDCSILLTHHFRKGGVSGEADAFRGASALIDAARAAVSLSVMSDKDAERLGVDDEERRFHIRADNAKLNLAPPPREALWLHLNNVELPNGDHVQAVSKWDPPSPWSGVPMGLVVRMLETIGAGVGDERYTSKSNGSDKSRWAGQVIMDEAGKTASQAKDILRAWMGNGLLEESKYYSSGRRKEISGLTLNHTKFSEMRRSNKEDGSDE